MKPCPNRSRIKMTTHRKAVALAVVGGSGSGKTWFADRLAAELGGGVARLNLDNFYRDRSHLTLAQRARLNFDNPIAIDWKAFEAALTKLLEGKSARIPTYDFSTHARGPATSLQPCRIVIADGLWLLRKASIRRLFDITLFLRCPQQLRFSRRLKRDTAARGRTTASVKEQFKRTVQPMHSRFVEPQAALADRRLKTEEQEEAVKEIAGLLRSMCAGGCANG